MYIIKIDLLVKPNKWKIKYMTCSLSSQGIKKKKKKKKKIRDLVSLKCIWKIWLICQEMLDINFTYIESLSLKIYILK